MDDSLSPVLLRLAFDRGSVRGRYILHEGESKRSGTHPPVEASPPSEGCTMPRIGLSWSWPRCIINL